MQFACDINKYLNKFKSIQSSFLNFIDNEGKPEVIFQQLLEELGKIKIQDNKHEIKMILYIVAKISDNHHRSPYFFTKIFLIIDYFKDQIIKYFTNDEIFMIFRKNKRILLFLIQKRIMIMNENVSNLIITNEKYLKRNYHFYFAPELKEFINNDTFQNEQFFQNELPENFETKRANGEDDSYLCQLIRNDSIDEFIIYANQTNLNLQQKMNKKSIYETNRFLLKKKPTIIEYATFFGSIQIFLYLINNKIKLTSNLWLYAIHSNNAEIIEYLEKNHINPPLPFMGKMFFNYKRNKFYLKSFQESIKCYHNEIAYHIEENYLQELNAESLSFTKIFKYYNFSFIDSNKLPFYELIKFDYYILVDLLLKFNEDLINDTIVNKLLFFQ